jgi:hypothetical protein
MRNGMSKDFSWDASAKEYIRAYERARQVRGVSSDPRAISGNPSLALV